MLCPVLCVVLILFCHLCHPQCTFSDEKLVKERILSLVIAKHVPTVLLVQHLHGFPSADYADYGLPVWVQILISAA